MSNETSKQTGFQRTSEWLAKVGKVPGNREHFSVQLGCHIEEFLEMINSLEFLDEDADLCDVDLNGLADLGEALKMGEVTAIVHDAEELLDSICDQTVTLDGVAFLAGFDKDGADKEVVDKNFDKFNADGTPVLKAGGKIGKREGWTPPALASFLGSVVGQLEEWPMRPDDEDEYEDDDLEDLEDDDYDSEFDDGSDENDDR